MNANVFGNYERAALDREYDNRAKVPDFAAYLERWRPRNALARDLPGCRRDVPFGPSEAETLDLFPGSGARNAAINVFYHGGYWKAFGKDDFSFVAHAFQPRGAITVVVNYALLPGVDMDELVRQCRAALAWVWRNAPEFGGDRERVYVSGHSAGGHLAAMLMATDWAAFDPRLPAEPIAGACGISGLYDLEPIRLCFLNDDLHLTEADIVRNSPVRHPRPGNGSVLLPVGELEGPEYLRQSRQLASAWRGRVSPHLLVMPGMHHFSIVDQLDDPDSALAAAIHRQMGLT